MPQPIDVMHSRLAPLALITAIVAGCAPTPATASPSVSAALPSPTPTVAPPATSPSATPTAPARLQVSDAPLPATAGADLLFPIPGGTPLRAISFPAGP